MMKKFEEKQKAFLEKYKSPSGKTKYKRCVNSTLRYAGGKSLAVGLVVELLPKCFIGFKYNVKFYQCFDCIFCSEIAWCFS